MPAGSQPACVVKGGDVTTGGRRAQHQRRVRQSSTSRQAR